jgi:hypothetical protein
MPRDDDGFGDLGDEHTNEVQVDSVVGTPDASPGVVTSRSHPTDSSMVASTRPIANPRRPLRDMPPVWYGIVGVAGGITIGLLTAYLLGWVVP